MLSGFSVDRNGKEALSPTRSFIALRFDQESCTHTHSSPKQQSIHTNSGGGGGGFFLAGEDFGRMSDHPFPTSACLLSLFRFVFVFALGSGD